MSESIILLAISSLFATFGAIVGTLITNYVSNRATKKEEKNKTIGQKIEEKNKMIGQKIEEKNKMIGQKIEEMYDLTCQINRWIQRKKPSNKRFITNLANPDEDIEELLDKIRKNIDLYLQIEDIRTPITTFYGYTELIVQLNNIGFDKRSKEDVEDIFKRFDESHDNLRYEWSKIISNC